MTKIIFFMGLILGCSDTVGGANSPSFIFLENYNLNYDGVTLGSQVWMRNNLNVDKFTNGDPIPEARTMEEWQTYAQSGIPAWCYYGNNASNEETYGKLYNWYAVNDTRGLAPLGWHIPSDSEWVVLTKFLGGEKKAGTIMKSTWGWNNNGNGTNTTGFNGLPGGFRDFYGNFSGLGSRGEWWSTGNGLYGSIVKRKVVNVWLRSLTCYDERLGKNLNFEGCGMSVRCLRD